LLKKILINNYFLLFILSSIWSSAFIGIKIAVETINPISVASLRLTVAAIFLCTIFFLRGYKFNLTITTYIYIFFIALIGNFIPFYLISWSEIYISSSLAGLLLSIAPIFALLLSHFFTKGNKFNILKLIGIILGFIGVVLLIGIENILNGLSRDSFLLIPKIAVILAALGYVISSIIAYNLKNIDTFRLTTIVILFASITSLPFMFLYEFNNISNPSAKSIIAVVYLGVMPTAVAYLLRFYIIAKAGPVFLSYVAYLIPIFAILWGAIFLNEKILLNYIIAMFFIFTGIFIGEKGSNESRNLQ